jgi:hypothetical protein
MCDRGSVDGAAYWKNGPDDFFKYFGTTLEVPLFTLVSISLFFLL